MYVDPKDDQQPLYRVEKGNWLFLMPNARQTIICLTAKCLTISSQRQFSATVHIRHVFAMIRHAFAEITFLIRVG